MNNEIAIYTILALVILLLLLLNLRKSSRIEWLKMDLETEKENGEKLLAKLSKRSDGITNEILDLSGVFIGRNGLSGYITGRYYNISVLFSNGKVYIKNLNEEIDGFQGKCEYYCVYAFLKDWRYLTPQK